LLIGGFNHTRPLLAGYAVFPDVGASGQIVFLIDTGADASLIGPGDCVTLGLEPHLSQGSPSAIHAPTPVIGISGSIVPYILRAYLFFLQRDSANNLLPQPYCRVGQIDVLAPSLMPTPDPSQWPMSCLGWDVLQHMESIDFHLGQGKVFCHLPA